MKEELKNIFLMGLGAIALTEEKTSNLKDELLEKGNELYTKGQIKNEELKHDLQEKIKENVTVTIVNPKIEDQIKNMTDEEINNLKKIIKEKENGK